MIPRPHIVGISVDVDSGRDVRGLLLQSNQDIACFIVEPCLFFLCVAMRIFLLEVVVVAMEIYNLKKWLKKPYLIPCANVVRVARNVNSGRDIRGLFLNGDQ